MSRSSISKAGVKDWVDSTFYDSNLEPLKPFEQTRVQHRDANELFEGADFRELDIELDTVPAELLDLIEKR